MEALMCNEDDANFRISQKLYLGLGGIGNVYQIHLAKYYMKTDELKVDGLYRGYVVTMEEEVGEDLQRLPREVKREVTIFAGDYDDLKRLERESYRSSFIQVMAVFEDDTVTDGAIAFIEDVDSNLLKYFQKMDDDELFEISSKLCVVDFSETTKHIIRQLVGSVLHLQTENLCFGGDFMTDVYVKFRHKGAMPENSAKWKE